MNVAVAVASDVVPAWQRDCIDALRALDGVTVRVVRVGRRARQVPGGVAAALCGPMLAPAAVAPDAGDAAGADLVLDLTGDAADADAPLGVWSFRFGESGDVALPFAREIAAGRYTFEIALVRRLDGRRERLRTGRFGITFWYPSTLRLALREASRWPATLIAALRDGIVLHTAPDAAAPAHAPPNAFERARFAASLAARLAAAVVERLFGAVEWNVGFVMGGPRVLLSGEPFAVRWLARPKPGTFVADPFVAERDGVRALFVEDFDAERDRGVIDALVLDDRGEVVRRVRALERATHLSYPYPVEFGGELYLMPENRAGGEVALYRCVRFPDTWERAHVVFAFDGVDTTMFAHGGRWWAMCTRWSSGSSLGLHAFHAASPLGPWTAHPLNPVVVDVTSARPAGRPFVVDGILYRPGQDCSRSYGCGVALARVDELTPTGYRETVVRRLDGREFGRYAGGFHTVSFTRDLVVVDGKRDLRDVRVLVRALKRASLEVARLLAPR